MKTRSSSREDRSPFGVAGLPAAALMVALSTACASTPRPTWQDVTITATGRGVYPDEVGEAQAQLMAERGARVDGYRKLTEQIYGVSLSSTTTVRDQVLRDDRIESAFEGFIRKALVLDTRRLPEVGVVEIDMELTLDEDFLRILGWRTPRQALR